MNKEWSDSIMEGVNNTVRLLSFMLKERSQLYGTLIHLMLQFEKREIIMPPIEVFNGYGKKYYVNFDAQEDGTLKVYLKLREDYEAPILD
jgi:hypothetical protein